MASHKEKMRKKWHHLELVLGIVICSVLIVLLATPFAFGYYYKARFYPKTSVAGINVSNLTLNESQKLFTDKIGDVGQKKIALTLADKNYSLKLSTIKAQCDYQKTLSDLFQSQRNSDIWHDGFSLVTNLVRGIKTNEPLKLAIDQDILKADIDTMLKEVNRDPVNAQIRVDNNQFVIDKDVFGIGVDKDNLKKTIESKILSNITNPNAKTITINFPSTQLEAKIKESALLPVKTLAENMVKTPLILTFEDKKYTYNNQSMAKWIKFDTKDDQVSPSYDRSQVDKDILTLSKKIDIRPSEKLVSSIDASVIQEGKDGRALNRTKTVNDIVFALNTNFTASQAVIPNQSLSFAPPALAAAPQELAIGLQVDPKPFETKTVAPPFNPGMYPGKYIEANLSTQMLYAWDGQNLVKQYRMSSGKKSTPTREGIFYIKNKASVGRSFPWEMPWWMAFAQDHTGAWQGFHELPVDMRTGLKEGINDIGKAVSHGCIRLPIGESKEFYEWAEVGIPVYVHK